MCGKTYSKVKYLTNGSAVVKVQANFSTNREGGIVPSKLKNGYPS